MSSTIFRIARASTTVPPGEPPLAAWPDTTAAPVVRYPKPTRRTGTGLPAGIIGKPRCTFGRSRIRLAGINFYNDLFSTATIGSAYIKARLWDERTNDWKLYAGIAWRPEIGEAVSGSAYTFADFRMALTELVEIEDWSVEYPGT